MITFQKLLLPGPTGNQLKEDRRGQFAPREEQEEKERKEAVDFFETLQPKPPIQTIVEVTIKKSSTIGSCRFFSLSNVVL